MPTNYPTALDDFVNPAAGSTLANPPHHTQHGDLNDALEAIEAELGLSPSGASATVRARAEAIEAAAFGAGAAFPAQPAYGNDRPFYRTDLAMWFYYDGTLWLSTTLYAQNLRGLPVTVSAAGVTVPVSPIAVPHPGLAISPTAVQMLYSVAGGASPLSASHWWHIQLNYTPADVALAYMAVDSGASAGTIRTDSGIPGGVSLTSNVYAYLQSTKTGTPGDLTVYEFTLFYRLSP